MSDLAYTDDIVILSSSEMQGLLDAANHHAAEVGMWINASKTKVMSALIRGEQAKLSCLMLNPWRMWTNSSTSA